MTTQPLSVSVISAPLAAIDRRALSQAWYSALHLSQSPAAAPVRARPRTPQLLRTHLQTIQGGNAAASHRKAAALVDRRNPRLDRPPSVAWRFERRAAKTALACRIERALARRGEPPKRLAFVIDGSGARVHLVVQSTRSGIKLIALCSSRLRDEVDRALGQARFALAARGIEVDACS